MLTSIVIHNCGYASMCVRELELGCVRVYLCECLSHYLSKFHTRAKTAGEEGQLKRIRQK